MYKIDEKGPLPSAYRGLKIKIVKNHLIFYIFLSLLSLEKKKKVCNNIIGNKINRSRCEGFEERITAANNFTREA